MKRNRGAKKIGGAYAWDAITVTPLITDLVNCKYLPSTMYEKDVNYFLRNNSRDNCYISNAMNGLDFKTQKMRELRRQTCPTPRRVAIIL